MPRPIALIKACLLSMAFAASLTAADSSIDASTGANLDDAGLRAAAETLADRDQALATVDRLARSGDVRVVHFFRHIIGRRVVRDADGALMVKGAETDAGELAIHDLFATTDADGSISGPPIGSRPSDELSRFRIYRRARGAINDALAIVGLYGTDTAARAEAAKDAGNKGLAEAFPRLQELAGTDPSTSVRRPAAVSAALLQITGVVPDTDDADRIAAAGTLAANNSIRALDPLRNGLRGDLPPTVAQAYRDAIDAIETHISIVDWTKHLFSGLSLGSILLLIALGLAITFGLMGVINMAHGEMLMIGAITAWACFEFVGTALPPEWFNWYYVIAAPLAFLTAGVVGLLTEMLIVRWLYNRPLDSLLATIGVSFILIQAVRTWKGDNLGMTSPTWFTGGWEILPHIVLPYNRIFLIVLALSCLASVVVLFRYTRMGLLLRATVQGRDTAASLGVNTRAIDMFTFSLGAGLAGLAGYGLVLITNPTPEMGQTYIVKAFLVTVVGGVGKLLGVVAASFGLGIGEKFIEPVTLIEEPLRIFDAAWAQVAVLLLVILFITRRPGGLFPDKGRLADQPDRSIASWQSRPSRRQDWAIGGGLAAILLLVVPLFYGTGFLSGEFVNKLGFMCAFAICAIGLDLIWGYMGSLSLCQFLFFALGGYAMGLYLVNHGPHDVNGIPQCLAYVMSDVSDPTPPWFLPLFDSFPGALLLGITIPGLLALLVGLATFRSRVRGVYFAILTQAITVAAMLVFEKNDLKLGGTNGLTGFDTILGFTIAGDPAAGPFAQTRFWLYVTSVLVMLAAAFGVRRLMRGGFGRVLLAVRDDETRLRFNGYRTWTYKVAAFVLAAALGGIGGMLYVPQKGIITPGEMVPLASIMVVAWVAIGGRATVWGAVIGTLAVELLQDRLTSSFADSWLFVLGGLFILVPLLLPGGLMQVWQMIADSLSLPVPPSAPPRSDDEAKPDDARPAVELRI